LLSGFELGLGQGGVDAFGRGLRLCCLAAAERPEGHGEKGYHQQREDEVEFALFFHDCVDCDRCMQASGRV